jgi:hypothetical protein
MAPMMSRPLTTEFFVWGFVKKFSFTHTHTHRKLEIHIICWRELRLVQQQSVAKCFKNKGRN